ncbi:unnamed protein product [Closterium sp. NIES-54]
MDVWGPARVRGQGHEHYFLLVVDDYSRYTTVFPLRSKGDVTEVLIDWIRAARLQLRESFGSDFPVLHLHSGRGGEFSSARLGAFCRAQGIRQTFTLPASPQQNGIAERRIGMVMDVARTSMIHAAAPHFLWPFAVQYAVHQINLQPRVSLPETSPTLRWTGKVGDASAFRVWGSRAFVCDLSADKLSPRAVPCVFLGFPPDAPGWQFYHPTSRCVLSSQDVTLDESVPYYRLFPYRTAPLPPPPLFLAPGPPPVDPLPPQGPAPSGVSQVDAVKPVEVAVDSARGAEPVGAGSGGAESVGAESGGAESGGAEPGGAEPGGAESGVAEPGGAEPGGAESARVASRSASSRRELLSPQELREWFARRWNRAAGAGGPPVIPGHGGARTGGIGAVGTGGAAAAAGVGPAGASGAAGAGAAGGVGAGVGPAGGTAGAPGGTGAAGPAGVGVVGAGGDAGTGAATGGTGAVPVGTGGPARPRSYFILLLEQVLGLPPSPGPAPPLDCPQPVLSQSPFQPVSPLPAPSPYAGPTGGLAERREPASRPASPVRTTRTSRRAPRPRPLAVPGTNQMTLRPSTAPLRVPLPSPPESSLPVLVYSESDSLRAARPTVARLLSTVVTDPSFESTAASALVAELVDFAARCRLDYASRLVAESESVCPPSVGGECALSTDVLEDRQEEFQCFAAALPHLVSTLIAPEGDPDAPDIPTPRSYAEAIEGPYSSQWQSAMDAEMASWKSTGTYVDEVPPPGANISSQPDSPVHSFRVDWCDDTSARSFIASRYTKQDTRSLTYLLADLGEPPRSPPVLLCGEFVIHPELALLCLTGLVTSCSPPLCLWGFSYLYPTHLLVHHSSFLQMSKVLIAEGLGYNLLSVSQLMAKSIHLEADSTTQEFKLLHGKVGLYIGRAVLKNNVFVLDFVPDQGTADSDAIVNFASWTHPPDLDPDFSPGGFWYSHTIPEAERTRALATIRQEETTSTAVETTSATTATLTAPIASSSTAPTFIDDTPPTPAQQLAPTPREVHRSANFTAGFYTNSNLYRRVRMLFV